MLNRLLVAAAVLCILISDASVARAIQIYNWSFPASPFPVLSGQLGLPDTGCDIGCAAIGITVDQSFGSATDTGRRHRACQQACPNGLGHDG
jgi:hypothetical protein